MSSAEEPTERIDLLVEDVVKRLSLKGRLAELVWLKVSPKEPPNIAAAAESDVVYGIRTTDDIVRAQSRKPKSPSRKGPSVP